MLSLSEVERAALRHNVIPLSREVPADLLTPLSALLAVRRPGQPCFLLESVVGGERIARYSFLGTSPYRILRARGDELCVEAAGVTRRQRAPVLPFIEEALSAYKPLQRPDLPRFSGGAVGYFSYDCARLTERLPQKTADLDLADDVVLMFFDTVLAFDHARQRLVVIGNVMVDDDVPLRVAYDHAVERIEAVLAQLSHAPASPLWPGLDRAPSDRLGGFTPCASDEAFKNGVRRAKRHIKRGDIFQAVLSQRWQRRVRSDSLSFYRMLRRLNPSPYMYYLAWADRAIAGTSPEMLARAEDGFLETRPIAGTRPRGKDADEDLRLEAEMKSDPKERAEHVMLVDLGRNDLGRVCEPGSVTVPELMAVERYSHVMHMVSSVRGRLRPEVGPLRALMACFPAGTVTGAPKVRAMEIIEDIEATRRGIYGGAVTYFDFHGNLDSCITIRTVTVHGQTATAQAGAGIVADSDPERELSETEAKAQVLFHAIDAAEALAATREAHDPDHR